MKFFTALLSFGAIASGFVANGMQWPHLLLG